MRLRVFSPFAGLALSGCVLVVGCGGPMTEGEGGPDAGGDSPSGRDVQVVPTDGTVGMDVVRNDVVTPPADVVMPPADVVMGTCPAPPAGVTANAMAAHALTNQVRLAMGLRCQTMVTTINTAATNHCNYYSGNRAMAMCVSNPHAEVMGCPMFTGASFANRMTAAGYRGSPAFEVMAFVNNGTGSVQMWIDSIWHRTPVLSPWTLDMGYGSAAGCDTIDYGVGAGGSVPATTVASYPYPNMINVPPSFSGNEGPPPPAPPTGWPSGYPVHLYAQGVMWGAHTLTLEGSTTDIPHVWLAPGDPRAMGLLRSEAVLYANRPLTARTRYHVHVDTTRGGAPVPFDFVFTTR